MLRYTGICLCFTTLFMVGSVWWALVRYNDWQWPWMVWLIAAQITIDRIGHQLGFYETVKH